MDRTTKPADAGASAAASMNGATPPAETLESLPSVLRSVLAALYEHDAAPLENRICSNCSVVTESGEAIHGRDGLLAYLARFDSDLLLRLGESAFRLLEPNAADRSAVTQAAIAGSYRLYTATDTPFIFSAECHATALFQHSAAGSWQVRHLHFSRKESRQVDDGLFPIETSRATYDYVRRILRTARKTGLLPSRIVMKDGTQLHYLDPHGILYVEALGKRCVVHQVDGALPLNTLLSEAESQLPGTFVRTHRSYLVNVEHVASIERCRITLSDGTKLPIPKQRFDQVRCELELRVADS